MNKYRDKTIDELNSLLQEKREEKTKLAQEILKDKEKDVTKIKKLRKDIARIQTAVSFKKKEIDSKQEDKNE